MKKIVAKLPKGVALELQGKTWVASTVHTSPSGRMVVTAILAIGMSKEDAISTALARIAKCKAEGVDWRKSVRFGAKA